MQLRRPAFAMVLAALVFGCAARRPVPPPMLFPIVTAWRTPLAETVHAPLASDGGRVFVATRDGVVHALQRLTGETLWRANVPDGPLATAPGVVLVRAEESLTALDPENGRTLWSVSTGIAGAITPVPAGDAVFVAGQGLARRALAGGAEAWTSREGVAVAPPVVHGDRVYTSEDDGTLRARDAATGRTLWAARTGSPLAAPPVVDAKGRVLLGTTDRRFLGLDPRDGKIRWTWRLGADVRTPPAVLDELVVFAAYDDVLYALRAGNGHLAWRAPLPSRPQSGPVIVQGAVLVSCHGGRAGETYVAGFDGHTGARQGDLRLPGEVGTPPLLVEGHLYLGLRDRSVVGLQLGG